MIRDKEDGSVRNASDEGRMLDWTMGGRTGPEEGRLAVDIKNPRSKKNTLGMEGVSKR